MGVCFRIGMCNVYASVMTHCAACKCIQSTHVVTKAYGWFGRGNRIKCFGGSKNRK